VPKESNCKEHEEYALYDSHTGVLLDRGSYENVMSTLAYDIAITHRNLDDFTLKMLVVKEVATILKSDLDTQLHAFVKNFRDAENGNGGN
jgi:hypothetical protein